MDDPFADIPVAPQGNQDNAAFGDLVTFGGGRTGTPNNLNFDPEFGGRLHDMLEEYNSITGRRPQFNSGSRSYSDQVWMQAHGTAPAASPGTSPHERGDAADFNTNDVLRMSRLGLLQKYGLEHLSGSEIHHIQLAASGDPFSDIPVQHQTPSIWQELGIGSAQAAEPSDPFADIPSNPIPSQQDPFADVAAPGAKPTPKDPGYAGQIIPALTEAVTGAPSFVANVTNPLSQAEDAVDMIAGIAGKQSPIPDWARTNKNPLIAQHALNQIAGVAGLNPEDTPAVTPGERAVRQGVTLGASALAGGWEEGAVNVLRNIAIGSASGAAGSGASELVPDNLKPLVNDVVTLATGAGLGFGAHAYDRYRSQEATPPPSALSGEAPPPPSDAPPPGSPVGIRVKNGPPRRATVEEYFDNGNAASLRMDDGTLMHVTTDDLRQKATAPPPPTNEQVVPEPTPAPGRPRTQAETEAFDLAGPYQPPVVPPRPGELFTREARMALDQAARLRSDALNETVNLTGEQRQGMMQRAGELEYRYGFQPGAEPNIARPPQARPAEGYANAGDLQAARNINPENYTGTYQRAPDPYRPPSPQTPPMRPPDLLQHLAARGGMRDQGGELSYIGANQWHRDKPFQKMLVRDSGLPLDEARREAQEMGYAGPEYNNFETIGDFLDAVRDSLHGKEIFPEHGGSLDYGQEANAWREYQGTQRYPSEQPEEWQEQQPETLEQLRAHADDLGIPWQPEWDADDLKAEIEERHGQEDMYRGVAQPDELFPAETSEQRKARLLRAKATEKQQLQRVVSNKAQRPLDEGLFAPQEEKHPDLFDKIDQPEQPFDWSEGIPQTVIKHPEKNVLHSLDALYSKFLDTYSEGIQTTRQDQIVDGFHFLYRRGHALGVEALVAHDLNGPGHEQMTMTANRPSSVSFSHDLKNRLSDAGSAIVIQHNHPSGSSLSNTDLAVLPALGIRWMSAIGHDGSVFYAKLSDNLLSRRNERLNAGEHYPTVYNSIQKQIMDAHASVRDAAISPEVFHAIRGGDHYLNVEEADGVFWHAVNEILRSQGLIDYYTTKKYTPNQERFIRDLAAAYSDNPYRPSQPVRVQDAMAILSGESEGAPGHPGSYASPEGGNPSYAGLREDESPGFYHELTRQIEGSTQGKASGDQWARMIDNLRNKGVKQEEIDWSGVKDWLKGQTAVQKDQLLDYLRKHEVRVHEVERGGPGRSYSDKEIAGQIGYTPQEWARVPEEDRRIMLENTRRDFPRDAIKKALRARYSSYRLPGGEDYRELLLTLKGKEELPNGWKVQEIPETPEGGWDTDLGRITHEVVDEQGDQRGIGTNPQDALNDAMTGNPENVTGRFQSGHWEEPNVMAHVRFDTRRGANGEKILHIAEVQSDWHQKGRSRGYNRATDEDVARAREAYNNARSAREAAYKEYRDADDIAFDRLVHGAPRTDMFTIPGTSRTDWDAYKAARASHAEDMIPLKAHKDALRAKWDAAQEAIDPAFAELQAVQKRAQGVPNAPFKTTWQELAMKRMLRYAAENGFDRLSWDTGDTNASRYPGREGRLNGMQGFYDKIIPDWVNKYVKKWGARVEPTDISGEKGSGGTGWESTANVHDTQTIPAHSIPITPEMREGVMAGQAIHEEPSPFSGEPSREMPDNAGAAADKLDNTSDAIADAIRGAPPGTYARALAQMAPPSGPNIYKDVNAIENFTIRPRVVAAQDTLSGRFYNNWRARDFEGASTLDRMRNLITPTFLKLKKAERDHVYAMEELHRLNNVRAEDNGLALVDRNVDKPLAQFSKPGSSLRLTPKETKAYFERRQMFDHTWSRIMQGTAFRLGWKRPWSEDTASNVQAIRDAAAEPGQTPASRKSYGNIADIVQEMEAQRRAGYVPLMRFGDYFISVTPKIGTDKTSLGGYPDVHWFELVERPPFRDLVGGKIKQGEVPDYARQRIADIQGRFPDHNVEHGWLFSKPEILRSLPIPAIEKFLMVTEGGLLNRLRDEEMVGGSANKKLAMARAQQRYDALYKAMLDGVRDELYTELKAGFKRRSRTIPGYSSDFDRTTGAYMGWASNHVADLLHRDAIDDSYNAIQTGHPFRSTKNYWEDWRQYMERPSNILSRIGGAASNVGFMYTLAGNPSSSSIIALHAPEMALPNLSIGAGMGRAAGTFANAGRHAIAAIRGDTRKGLFVDHNSLGATKDEKSAVGRAAADGLLHSIATDEMAGLGKRQSDMWGADTRDMMRRAANFATSNISVADQTNRAATFLTAYRLAKNPALFDKINKAWMRSQVWRDIVQRDGATPENFARFMISEAAGEFGKVNQARVMRGLPGQAFFLLHGFQTQYLATAFKLLKNMGPEGKIAFAWMMGALWSGAGIQGLPFVQDAEKGADWIWKEFTGKDPMLAYRMQSALANSVGKVGAEMIMRGPVGTLLGVDLADRIGFGDVISREFGQNAAFATLPSIFVGRAMQAERRRKSGQGAAAAIELLPSSIRNPAMGLLESERGEKTAGGKPLRAPNQIPAADAIKKMLGFRPNSAERSWQNYDFNKRNTSSKMRPIRNPIPDPNRYP